MKAGNLVAIFLLLSLTVLLNFTEKSYAQEKKCNCSDWGMQLWDSCGSEVGLAKSQFNKDDMTPKESKTYSERYKLLVGCTFARTNVRDGNFVLNEENFVTFNEMGTRTDPETMTLLTNKLRECFQLNNDGTKKGSKAVINCFQKYKDQVCGTYSCMV